MAVQSLNEFIIKHCNNKEKSYNGVQSRLEREFQAKKLGKIYSLHRYWTKQPINVIEQFIIELTEPGDLVLDPFCGVGTTGVAARKNGRKAILLDISPIAVFLAENYLQYLSDREMKLLDQAYLQISNKISLLMVDYQLYRTTCRQCGNEVNVRDYIYSEMYSCPTCSTEILFCKGDWEEISSRKRSRVVTCDFCKKEHRRKKLGKKFIRFEPIAVRYSCKTCSGQKKIFSSLSKKDRKILELRKKQDIDVFYPVEPLPEGVNTKQPLSRDIDTVDKFFTPNGLAVLALLFQEIKRINHTAIRQKLIFVFTSIIFRTSKMYRLRVDGQGGVLSGTLYIPPVFQDINPMDVFKERFRKIWNGQKVLNRELKQTPFFTSVISATDLYEIPDSTIDYIYTDPPYAGNINYSELNLLWEAWLGERTRVEDELIVNKYQNKDLNTYQNMLTASTRECWRILKEGRVMTLVFHHTEPAAWGVLQRSIVASNFQKIGFSKISFRMMTAKQTESRVAAQGFLLLHFLKKQENRQRQSLPDFNPLYVRKLIREYFDLPNAVVTREKLYDHVIAGLFDACWIEPFNLESLLEEEGFNSSLRKK
ncbi:MAG: DNA methyltransferase [Candidatus Hodarchaeales archaeon]